MRRRRLLALTALPLAMAGCLADDADPGNDDGDDDQDDQDDDSDDDDGDDSDDGTDDGDDDPSDNDEPTDRIDTPPYEINPPDPPTGADDEDDWNDRYLGEHMPTEPSLAFEVITTRRGGLPGFEMSTDTARQYRADLLTTEDDVDALLNTDEMSEETRERVEGVDFETHVLVLVRSGWGSSSMHHRWGRVEDVDDGVHLHGYYTNPFIQTDDWTWRASLVEVERPDAEPDLARVSLTVNADERVNFDSTEGTVTIDAT